MIIKSMVIENYRPYKGPVTIDFARGDKNVTIIQGRNDAGKTSLINAVTWCLYNKEPFRDDGSEERWNKSYVKYLNNGEDVSVKVEILMEDEMGRNVHFIREQIFTKIGNGECKEKESPTLSIYRNEDGDDEPIKNPEEYISNNLPESLQEYFIFTGERLTQFFNKDENLVKEGVHALYQLDLIDNIYDQAKKWEKYYSNKFKDVNPELEKLKSERSACLESLKLYEIELRENKNSINSLKLNIDNWKKMRGDEGGDAKDIVDKIDRLETEITSKESELENKKSEYASELVNNFSKIMSYDVLLRLDDWENFEEDSPEDEIISIAIPDLKKLLKQHKCMCGAELIEGSEQYKNLSNLLNVLEETQGGSSVNIESLIRDVLKLSNNLLGRYPESFENTIINLKQDIAELKNDINTKKLAIDRLNIQLHGLNIEEIERLTNLIDTNQEILENLIARNGVLQDEINHLPNYIDELNQEIKKLEDEIGENNIYDQKRGFCESIKLISKDIYDDLARGIYTTLSDLVTEEYINIHWKPDIKEIIVDQDFQVFVKKSGDDIVSALDPSTGSRNVLALTFMAALNSLSGFTLPQIIDTPIASLDGEMRENVAKSLPKYMKGKQMILLVMDTEYTADFKINIDKYVGERYMLDYVSENDDGDGQTLINKF